MNYYGKRNRIGRESDKFNAYLVTSANASSLQSLLNTHGSVRLDDGDFSGSGNITLSTGQSLYGWYTPTIIGGTITIAEGSSNVTVQNIDPDEFIFESGNEINNCTFKNIYNTDFSTTGGKIRDCTWINSIRCLLLFDCSVSGYLRNNTFIKTVSHSPRVGTNIQGNDTESSYGNIEIFRNSLTPSGDGFYYQNLDDHTIIGGDIEAWNYSDNGVKGGIYVADVGTFKLSTFLMGNNGSYDTLPALDIQADKFLLSNSTIEENGSNPSIIRANTDFGKFYSIDHVPTLENSSTSFSFEVMNGQDGDVLVNGINRNTEITGSDVTSIENLILPNVDSNIKFEDYYYTELITGINWRSERIGKTDSLAFIQNLIDTNNIAELSEGVYYVSDSIVLEDGKGIVGKGKNKTVIVGLTDDFPILEHVQDTTSGSIGSVKYYLSDFTVQGGSIGLRIAYTGANKIQLAYNIWENVTFRDQTYGIHLDKFYGFDNNFLGNISFINCNIGFFQDPDFTPAEGEANYIMYVDKTLFYNCEAINCGTAFSMIANRASGGNIWYNCYFNMNVICLSIDRATNDAFVNCEFKNTIGDYVLDGFNFNMISFFGCLFKGNDVTKMFNVKKIFFEDCYSEDTAPLMELDAVYSEKQVLICNSDIQNSLGDVNDGLLINSLVNNSTALSKELVKVTNDVPLTLIDKVSVPTPQFFTTN